MILKRWTFGRTQCHCNRCKYATNTIFNSLSFCFNENVKVPMIIHGIKHYINAMARYLPQKSSYHNSRDSISKRPSFRRIVLFCIWPIPGRSRTASCHRSSARDKDSDQPIIDRSAIQFLTCDIIQLSQNRSATMKWESGHCDIETIGLLEPSLAWSVNRCIGHSIFGDFNTKNLNIG
jgi:hypothetical protein